MEEMRKPFQGVWNIIRFNWHFYVLSFAGILFVFFTTYFIESFRFTGCILFILIIFTSLISLLVSWYVYDLSGLYKFKWMDEFKIQENTWLVNINAGFDETSPLFKDRFKNSPLKVLDFYDPLKHTEISIRRARKAYPPFPGTLQVLTRHVPLPDNDADIVFVIFSAHEIRNEDERIIFFKEINRILKTGGKVVVMEHLRDFVNFLAYNIGFLHFHSKSSWIKTFDSGKFKILKERKFTPFISIFILEKNGTSF
jgi:hypothetical protein